MSILDSNCNIWINANAGSGKTTSLVKRFLSLVLNGTDFDKILCITYTKTAAKEMQHRITSVLQKWQLLNEQDLEQELENYTLENTRFYLQKASGLYDEIINSGKAFKISTIHSFCHNLLKQYGNVTEVTKETEILNNEIVDKLKKAIKQKLAKIDGEVLNEYRFILKHKGDFFIDNLMEEVFENIAFHTQNIGKNWEELIPDDALFLIKNEQSLSIFKDEITHSINNIGIDVLKAFLLELKIKIDIEENDDFFEAVCKGLLTKAGELRKLKLEKIKNERVVNIISDWQSFIAGKIMQSGHNFNSICCL
jgi:ATP-dependent exoDNAse (exonuclease V) beta subunit